MDTEKMIGGTLLDRFFVECTLGGTDFDNEEDIAKAKEIAKKYNLSYPFSGIESLYLAALENHKELLRATGFDR